MPFFFNFKAQEHLKMIIIGAGEMGFHIASRLERENKEVIFVDTNAETLRDIADVLDVQTVHGEGSSPVVLERAGIEDADILLAVTDSDQVNIIASLFGNKLSPKALTVARIRNEDYTRGHQDLFHGTLGINVIINPEEETASTVERMLSAPGALEYHDFFSHKLKLLSFFIQEGPLLDCELRNFKKIAPEGVIVAGIVRDEMFSVPSGNDVIKKNDIVYFACLNDKLDLVRNLVVNKIAPAKDIMIVGGGNMGLHLARLLEEYGGYNVKVVDKDEDRCYLLADILDSSLVLHGDGADLDFLMEENAGDMDAVVALTGFDETNILISLLAKSLGAKMLIPRLDNNDYFTLVEAIGIHSFISPTSAAVNSVLRYIRRGKVISAVSIRGDEAEAIEAVVLEGSKIVGTSLEDLNLPKGVLIMAIKRKGEVLIPWGKTVIEPDDHIVIMVALDRLSWVEKVLADV
jgi:trk system potassium uptake protein TrkA